MSRASFFDAAGPKRVAMVAMVALLAMMSGCASFQGAPERSDDKVSLEDTDRLYHDTLRRYYDATTVDQQKLERNRFIEVRAGLIDRKYSAFKQAVYEQRVGANVGVDVATLGLNAVGAATGSTSAKTALHAISGGLIGSKASVDKNVYFDRTLPALLAQMDALRATVRLRMLNGMLVPTDRYALMQAAADLEDYFHAGTVAGAIAGITTQSAVEQQVATQKLNRGLPSEAELTEIFRREGTDVQRVEKTATGEAFGACLRPGGKLIPENEKLMKDWLEKKKFAGARSPSAVFDFLKLPANEQLRKDALADTELHAKLQGCKLPGQ